ncbi:ABC transporter substrate-binding protein [Egicoccus sp. AB-alg2]|uniref:ABC transporter substrate-binding protein n=1 Tax=Egicoccus sp. AB-alg2 TaxID=3242693 RepID=UPI00359CF06A
MRTSKKLALLAAVGLTLAATGCGGTDGGDAPAEDAATQEEPTTDAGDDGDTADDGAEGEAAGGDAALEELVAAAEAEGSLTFYSVPDESIAQGIADEFSSRYDIQVDFVRLVSADLAQRYSAEASSGAPAADLILVSDSPFLTEAFEENWLTPLSEAGLPDYGDFPEEFVIRDGASAIVSINPTVIGYNTNEAEEPADWDVLADPENRGRIAISDPTTSVANLFFWDLIREEYGDDFLRSIGENDPIFTPGAVPSAQAVGAGEVIYATPAVSAIYDNLAGEGAPVAYGSPSVTTGSEIAVGISTEAANPNAARLFAWFIMTQEGNELLTLPYNTASPYGGGLPEDYRRPNNAALANEDLIYELLGVNN